MKSHSSMKRMWCWECARVKPRKIGLRGSRALSSFFESYSERERERSAETHTDREGEADRQ
jgi:hypothetical protein